MTQEDIELLATDISARVKHGVQVMLIENEETMERYKLYLKPYPLKPMTVLAFINYDVSGCSKYKLNLGGDVARIEDCKPYLRPMSSMTEEEYEEYSKLWNLQDEFYTDADIRFKTDLFDWLNKKMFGYRTLDGKDMFELGIALRAPEGMYKNK